jgi:hypothetical protein
MELKETKGEALQARKGPIHPGSENNSANHTPGLEEIRFRAYEIHLARGGFPGNELADWLQAERELQPAVPPIAQQFQVAGKPE